MLSVARHREKKIQIQIQIQILIRECALLRPYQAQPVDYQHKSRGLAVSDKPGGF
jgi:hypothetical protein